MFRIAAPSLTALVVIALCAPTFAQETPTAQAQTVVKIFSVANADAADITKVVDELLGTISKDSPSIARTATDARTNSIIASGTVDDLNVVEAIVKRLDEKKTKKQQISVFQLKNTAAPDAARSVSDWLNEKSKQGHSGEQQSAASTASRITADPISNSLIVTTADNASLKELETVIKALDTPPPTIRVNVHVKKKTEDGTKTITNSKLITRDHMQASIEVGTPEESFIIEITPTLIEPANRKVVDENKK